MSTNVSTLLTHSPQRFETLCKWIFTIAPDTTSGSIDDLGDGVLLNLIVARIDEHFRNSEKYVLEVSEETTKKLHKEHNLNLLLQNLTTFYQEKLCSIILLELPVIMDVCRDTQSQQGMESLERFLLLILGVAVQCENRVKYVDSIQNMGAHDQVVMMQAIQDVLEQQHKTMWDQLHDMSTDSLVNNCEKAFSSLNQAVAQRDRYAQEISELKFQMTSMTTTENQEAFDGYDAANTHKTTVRQIKTQMIELQDELDTKTNLVQELLEMYEQIKTKKLQLESKYRDLEIKLEDNAALRDEIDMWKAKLELATKTTVSNDAFEELSKDNMNLTSANDDLSDQVDTLQERNRSLREQVKSKIHLEARVEVMESESRTLRAELNAMTAAYERSAIKIKELNATSLKVAREREHQAAEIALQNMEQGGVTFESELANSTSDNKTIAILEAKLKGFEQRGQISSNAMKALNQKMDELEQDLEKQTALRLCLQTTSDSYADELQKLRASMRKLQEEKATMQTDAETTLSQVNHKLEKAACGLLDVTKKYESLAAKNKSERATTTKLEACLDKAQDRCNILQKELGDRDIKVRELKTARAEDISASERIREQGLQHQSRLAALISQNQLLLRNNDPSSPPVAHVKGKRSMGSRLNGLIRRIKTPSFSEHITALASPPHPTSLSSTTKQSTSTTTSSDQKSNQFNRDTELDVVATTPIRNTSTTISDLTAIIESPSTPKAATASPFNDLIGLKRMMLEGRVGDNLDLGDNLVKPLDSTVLETPKGTRESKIKHTLDFLLSSPKHPQSIKRRSKTAQSPLQPSRQPQHRDVIHRTASSLSQANNRRPLGQNNTINVTNNSSNRGFTIRKRTDLNQSNADMSQLMKYMQTPDCKEKDTKDEKWSELTGLIDMALSKSSSIQGSVNRRKQSKPIAIIDKSRHQAKPKFDGTLDDEYVSV